MVNPKLAKTRRLGTDVMKMEKAEKSMAEWGTRRPLARLHF